MNDYNSMPQAAHRLELIGRDRLTVSGVEDVERFDETGIIMSTSAGTLVITGEDLHIGKLSLDGGELHVDGRVDSVSYEDDGSGRGGFFGHGKPGLPPAAGVRPVHSAGPVRRTAVRPAAALPPPSPPPDGSAGQPVLSPGGNRRISLSPAGG